MQGWSRELVEELDPSADPEAFKTMQVRTHERTSWFPGNFGRDSQHFSLRCHGGCKMTSALERQAETGKNTVPQIFVAWSTGRAEYIGGYDTLSEWCASLSLPLAAL